MTAIPDGGDAVVSALRDCGVTTVFGIPASYTIEVYDALARQGGIRSITARNEQAAAFMADGYARRSGEPGVVIVTGGPGLGNAVTGLQTAYADSSPVVVIASDHDPARRAAHPVGLPHEALDQEGLAKAAGALVVRADDPGSVEGAVTEALAACRSGRPRPGVVLIGRSALEAPRSPDPGAGKPQIFTPPASTPPAVGSEDLHRVADLLRSAVNPVAVVGAGVVRGGACRDLARFLALTGLPAVTTAPGRHAVDRTAGWMGLLPDPGARALVEQADVVLALGTSFGSASTAEWTMRIDGALIHIDIDPASLGQHYRADLALRADVRSFLTSLIEVAASLPGLGPPRPRPPSPAPVSHPWIDPIEAALPARGVTICGDVTMASHWLPRAASLGPERRLFTPWNFMTLGWAYAAALGVQAAAPGDAVLAVMGDGGALFTLGELAAAVEHRLAVCLLVFNNRSYGIIAELQDRFRGGRRFGVDLEQPDFTATARAFGMRAEQAATPEQLEEALRRNIGAGEPGLIEVRVDIEDLSVDSAHL